jgi:hypothetical protein
MKEKFMILKKMFSLSLLALLYSSMAMAAEYKDPKVDFKKHPIPSKVVKSAEFGDHYKVDDGSVTDRQIASEGDPSEREPSSIIAKKAKKEVMVEKEEESSEGPKPWLYRNLDSSNKTNAIKSTK